MVAALVARGEPERREDSGSVRHEHLPTAELVGERAGVQRSGAAEGNEGELTWVVPALDRDDAKGPQHLGIDDLDDGCGIDPAERPRGGGGIEVEPTRQRRRQPANRRLASVTVGVAAAPAVAGRARDRPRRSAGRRAAPAVVAPDDRAASGTDGVDVDHRQADREPADLATVAALGPSAGDEADVRRRAAHVEGDRVVDATERGDVLRSTTPPAGPETRISAGCAAASSTVATPPDDRITSGSGRPARALASRNPRR